MNKNNLILRGLRKQKCDAIFKMTNKNSDINGENVCNRSNTNHARRFKLQIHISGLEDIQNKGLGNEVEITLDPHFCHHSKDREGRQVKT